MSIRIESLTKYYGTQKAVDNISFAIEKAEIVGFLGLNGAGKSTTMKIITGFVSPTTGNVTVNGLDIKTHSKQIRQQIGYLPEKNPLYTDMYVAEFLHFVARIYQMPTVQRKKAIPQIIEQTGLYFEQHKRIAALSKGYKQRVGLAQALIHNPTVLILDEPTGGLDPSQIIEIRNLIRTIGKSKTVLFSSHILADVEAVADRVVIIHQGKIIADAPIAELRTQVQGENRLKIEFEKPGFQLESLSQQPGFIKATFINPTHLIISTTADSDLRKFVQQEAIRQENMVLEMAYENVSLEDIFRRITAAETITPISKEQSR
jgi:ABC-2 type transport system ATP-binding protein